MLSKGEYGEYGDPLSDNVLNKNFHIGLYIITSLLKCKEKMRTIFLYYPKLSIEIIKRSIGL